MVTEKRLIDAKGKFVLNAGDITGHIMCIENGYATVFDRFAKIVCTFSLLDAPTVDVVEVVHGRWENERMLVGGHGDVWGYDCSICGNTVRDWKTNYCPNCGAKMDMEVDE